MSGPQRAAFPLPDWDGLDAGKRAAVARGRALANLWPSLPPEIKSRLLAARYASDEEWEQTVKEIGPEMLWGREDIPPGDDTPGNRP